MAIHPTAIISEQASIADDVAIGPYSVVRGRVTIGPGTVIESHAQIGHPQGRVTIGRDNVIRAGAVLGGAPQDLGYQDADTALVIGDRNRIGEYVSISLGTEKGGGETRLGDDNFIMAYTHIGHDCRLADHIVIANGTQLAGHILVEHHALLSGLAGVTQFCRLGAYSFLVAGAFANKDIVPYTIAEGHWAAPRATNRVGLKRAGFTPDERQNIDRAVRILLDRALDIDAVVARIERDCSPSEAVTHFTRFLTSSERGVARG